MAQKESFNNLIDICLNMEEDPEFSGNVQEMFKNLLVNYFFKAEIFESKSMELYFKNYSVPDFLENKDSLFSIDLTELNTALEGETVNSSLAGKIMLSKEYLKHQYPHHSPAFGQLPEDDRFELIDEIKKKNKLIEEAFSKMHQDLEITRSRTILTLIALIIKNIHRKTGRAIKKLEEPAETIIKKIFLDTATPFCANQKQMGQLSDDSNIKDLIKEFFIIRQFSEITELAEMFKSELNRFKRRCDKSNQ